MGQGQSGGIGDHATTEQLSHELALRFAKRCFTPLELYSFRDVFRSLADHQDSIAYLKEDTITRFLELPDVLGVSSVIFQMVSYIGAFPFAKDAPVVLGFEQMIMVVVIMSERYQRVLKNGGRDRTKLLFRSLAVHDRFAWRQESISAGGNPSKQDSEAPASQVDPRLKTGAQGFTIDTTANDENEDEDEDDLALAALESLDAIEVFKQGDAPLSHASIPSDNLKRLIMLLLLIAPLETQESLALYAGRLADDQLQSLRKTADNILGAFVNVEKSPGVKFHQFNTVIYSSMPFIFKGCTPLFEKFLFSNNIDLSKRRHSNAPPPHVDLQARQPLLSQTGDILDINVLSQLSFFIPGSKLFRRLRLLYAGGDAGFSMGSFETKVFNWRAPTLLLVSGSRITEQPAGGVERAFSDTLPPKRFRDSSKEKRVIFGAYISQDWHQTYKECFGDTETLLFQLEPVHEVFHASSLNKEYISFTKPPTSHNGIAFGNPHPRPKQTAGLSPFVSLGAVSLMLDSSFEFGVFTHNWTSGGGAFHNSETRKYDFQDRFEIESLEVWGCGGDEEAEQQRKRWEWEEREAEARRRVNLGTGDIDADRALLEMAGLVGANRSGGSMR